MSPVRSGDTVQGWTLDREIGSGSFARVWKATRTSSGRAEVAAIKVIATDRLSHKLTEYLDCEVSILKRISHPHIVKLYEVIKAGHKLYLVMEYCGGGDLATHLRHHRRLSEEKARDFMQQLSLGMKEMWLNNFVHRDLKPQNLLLSDRTDSPRIKIADFGFARNLQPQGLAETLCGSPLYMAPEILLHNKYDAKADLWSVGIILYELLVGSAPFDGSNYIVLLKEIQQREARVPEQIRAQLSPACLSLIKHLLKRNPVERISFTEFFSHPFLMPGELAASGSSSPMASSFQQLPLRLPMLGSSIHLASVSSGSSEHLPFSVERQVGAGEGQRPAARMSSEPLASSRQQIVIVSHPSRNQLDFTSGSAQARGSSTRNSVEEDDDYVIIERAPSAASISGLKEYSQSAPTRGFSRVQNVFRGFKPLPPPKPLSIPLLQTPVLVTSGTTSKSLAEIQFTSGLPRGESLRRIAHLLEELASTQQFSGFYAQSLALRLLALQVLNAALEFPWSPRRRSSSEDGSEKTEASLAPEGSANIAALMTTIADRAELVGNALKAEGKTEALPEVWDLLYRAALSTAKAAAVDELLGNYTASLRSYAKAGSLLYFIFAEGTELPLQPPLTLSPAERIRLQRYTVYIALRHKGCLGLAKAKPKSAPATTLPAPALPDPSAVPEMLEEASQLPRRISDPLAASVSAHPPLRGKER